MMYQKMGTLITLIFLSLICKAPEYRTLLIAKEDRMTEFDPLIKAITWVESMNGKYVYNEKENAVGWFQIRECRIDHYNRLTGSNYTLNDCYDYELSKKVFLYFAKGKSFEKAAKSWNGSGRMTISYWEKVRRQII
jgi:hypothetical protein